MATKLVDDLDGSSEGVQTIRLTVGDSAWEVDLTDANVEKHILKPLSKVLEAARPAQSAARSVTPIPKKGQAKGTRQSPAYPNEFTDNRHLFNEWLAEQGEQPTRGRVSLDKANAFAEAIRGGWSPKAA